MAATKDLRSRTFYHGTKADLKLGNLIEPGDPFNWEHEGGEANGIYVTTTPDAAMWQAELGPGEGPGRVYEVEPTGRIAPAPEVDEKFPVPTTSYRSGDPLRVTGLVTNAEGHPLRLYHGTKADLRPGDLIEAGRTPNFGQKERLSNYIYLTGTMDAAVWAAELARGDGPGRIYVVEPTGPITDDPNLTDKKYPGNPTKSYRTREPLRVTGEVTDWEGHSPEALEAMKDGLEELKRLAVEPIDE